MPTVVVLGEMPNSYPLIWVKICGSTYLIRKDLVGVISEIRKSDLIQVQKSRQIKQSLFNVILGHFSGLNKFLHCVQSCRGLRHLSFDTKITYIASVIWMI
jgi:hypothetical protein